jgi:hypothetical protein
VPTLKENTVIRHIFMWQVAEGHDKQKVVDLLTTLSERLPSLRSWELGSHQGAPNDNGAPWDGVLVSDFDSWEGLQEYSDDPFHLEVVAELKPMVAERAVVDFVREEV